MARTGITYEDVVAAIDSIVARGEEPTLDAIRLEYGGGIMKGSPNTVHKHKKAWKQSNPIAQRKAPELNAELQSALVREIDRQASEARSLVERDLAACQKEAESLARSGEELEEANASLEDDNAELLAHNGRLQALSDERQEEIKTLNGKLDTERKSLEEAHIQVAQGRNKIESLEEAASDLKDRIKSLSEDLKAAEKGRVDAEKLAAVADARLESEIKASADLRSQLEKMTSKHDELFSELRSAQKERSDLVDKNHALTRDLKDSNRNHAIETDKVASLETQLAEMKAKNETLENENESLSLKVEKSNGS